MPKPAFLGLSRNAVQRRLLKSKGNTMFRGYRGSAGMEPFIREAVSKTGRTKAVAAASLEQIRPQTRAQRPSRSAGCAPKSGPKSSYGQARGEPAAPRPRPPPAAAPRWATAAESPGPPPAPARFTPPRRPPRPPHRQRPRRWSAPPGFLRKSCDHHRLDRRARRRAGQPVRRFPKIRELRPRHGACLPGTGGRRPERRLAAGGLGGVTAPACDANLAVEVGPIQAEV